MRYFYLDDLGSKRMVKDHSGVVTSNEYDATGLLYCNARYYDPIVGRFLTEDPSRKGTGWYTYCGNNPINRVDPTGMDIENPGRSGFETPIWPVSAGQITSAFGSRTIEPNPHPGIDIAPAQGAQNVPVVASLGGVVTTVGTSPGGSSQVFITDTSGKMEVYKHMTGITVTQGSAVAQGVQIGTMGDVGSPGETHLHYEVRPPGSTVQAQAVDPVTQQLPPQPESITLTPSVHQQNDTLTNVQ